MDNLSKYIVADSKICGGKLVFTGTRIMVWQVLDALANGESRQSVLNEWPILTDEHISAALRVAARKTEGENIISLISPFCAVSA